MTGDRGRESGTAGTGRKPVVSVVIPCGGDLRTLPTQLAALVSQVPGPAVEVLVVNNGAPGDLDALAEQFPDPPFELRTVDATDRRGSSYARNVGAHAARCELLMFCDADDVVSTSWVLEGVRAFTVGPVWSGVAVALPDRAFHGGPGPVQALIDPTGEEPPAVPDTPERPTVLLGGNFGMTRRLFHDLGGFDVSVPHHGDDNDLAARVRLAGFRIPHVLSVRIAYRQAEGAANAFRQAYADSVAATLLAVRTDPEVPALRALAAAGIPVLRALGFPAGMLLRRQWEPVALVTRWCHVLGALDGALRYRVLHRVPPRKPGVGLDAPQS
ncbi:glycosyltransferase family 2 protein [Kocuria sp.]|uniref:glycosyltransferase family 2 protein n=1 Tax=Kocuria sp. TaxID=1871328 RepID=UPI0026DB4BE9|nr:glycosyltransferase family A protein [Kocuria sp.]MDO4919674.1 glycosyltransferase family A protein [Kocuria sp.]